MSWMETRPVEERMKFVLAVETGDPDALADQACEAAFYAGENAMLHGDPAGAKPLLTQAARLHPIATG